MPVYTAGTDVKPSDIAKQGLAEARKKNIDVVIVDTAGRLQVCLIYTILRSDLCYSVHLNALHFLFQY